MPFCYFLIIGKLVVERIRFNGLIFFISVLAGVIYIIDMTPSIKDLLGSGDFAVQRVKQYNGELSTYNSFLARLAGVVCVYFYPLCNKQ